MSTLG